METKDFFKEALDLTFEQTITQDLISKYDNDKYKEDEITRLKFYMMDKDKDDRIIIATWVIDDLLHAYYRTRQKIDPKSLADKINRSLMFFYQKLIADVSARVLWTLNIKLNQDFIREWKLKTSFFPFDFYFEGKPMPFIEREKVKAFKTKETDLPEELNTDEAKKWLQVAINGGLLNSDYSPTDNTKTKPQKALLAEILSDKIGLKYKFKPFETLWNVKGLSQQRYKSREETGAVRGGDVIMEVFKDK